MKNRAIFVLFLVVTFSTLVFTTRQLSAADLTEKDKEQHMQACAGISMATYGAFRATKWGRFSSSLMSFTVAMTVGLIKEATDPVFDHDDIKADAVGASAGLLIPLSFTF